MFVLGVRVGVIRAGLAVGSVVLMVAAAVAFVWLQCSHSVCAILVAWRVLRLVSGLGL